MMPSYYEFYNPVKIISGKGALENIPYELDQLGVSRPLVVTDPGVSAAGLVKYVVGAFAESNASIGALYDQVPPDSSIRVVNELGGIYRQNGCDSILAVGGGSVIDTAKGVNIVVTENSDDIMKFAGAETLKKPMKPLIVVPTTAGTGSEVTLAAVIADPERNMKKLFTSYHLLPRVAVLDPRMTMGLPPHMTAATAMDAMTHAVEAYICLQKNPMSDGYAWPAIRLIRKNLMNVIQKGDDLEGRLALANAACMAGAAFSNAMVGMVHTLGHACGSVCHVPHGMAMSILLPHGLEYNMHKVADHIAELLLPLAGADVYVRTPPEMRAARSVQVVRDLQQELHRWTRMPFTLKAAGVPREKLEEIAKTALGDGSIIFNPEELDYEDALGVLKKAYE